MVDVTCRGRSYPLLRYLPSYGYLTFDENHRNLIPIFYSFQDNVIAKLAGHADDLFADVLKNMQKEQTNTRIITYV